MPARVGLETRTAVKLRIAMSSSSATRAAGDMGLRPPSPAPTSPPPPRLLLCYPSTFKTTGGSLPALDEQQHPFHKERGALAVHGSGVARPVSSSLRAPQTAGGAAIPAAEPRRASARGPAGKKQGAPGRCRG